MRRMLVVAMREYQAAVKTKAFILSLILMPVLMGGGIVIQVLLRDKVDTKEKRVVVLDRSGQLFDAIAEAARVRNETKIFKGEGPEKRQVAPRFLIEKFEAPSDDPDQASFELSERVRKKEIFAYVVIEPDMVRPVEGEIRAKAHYHSGSPTYEDVQKWLIHPINDHVKELRLKEANVSMELVRKAIQPVLVSNLGLVSKDAAGNISKAEKTNLAANLMIPLSLLMLMFMVVMLGASPLMQSVIEEKMQRIVEVLLGSLSPFQLMMGKLLGMVGVSLTIATVYLVGGFLSLRYAGFASFFPTHLVWWFIVFQALAVLMFGSLFIAIGAAVTDMREAQSLVTPVMIIVCAPMFVWVNVIKEPMAPFSVVASLFPPATPMLMMVRQAVPPGIPTWQPLLGVVLVLLTTLLFVVAAGRIFRVGILMQGRGAKFGEMLRWVVRG